jgi:uncharacterized protein YutE (UPF0331/DUF86 family)
VPDDVVVQKLASIDRCLVAVHEYRRLDPAIVRTVVEHSLGDFEALCRDLVAAS